jgi:glycosyltransferase involved in cell wall biosynthesis
LRLLFLCKRHPQQRDLIERPYGRFYHLPVTLAARGHQVTVMLLSQRRLPSLRLQANGVTWLSEDVLECGPAGLWRRLSQQASARPPDWIIGCSDAWFGWLGHRLASRTGARLAVDAYDNYEAYMPWNLPLRVAWRRAVRAADMVTVAGPQLAQRLQSHRRNGRPVAVLPMTADPEFFARNRDDCRQALDLPVQAPLLGYAGSWTHSRGTHLLVDAFSHIRERCPEARLVLTGRPPDAALQLPNVIGVGYLADGQLPLLVSALDVACIVTADTAFGRYSYPAKLCEAMACRIPVVATATAAVRWMLGDRDAHLAPLGDAAAFADRALALLDSKKADYATQPSWQDLGQRMEAMLASA